MEYYKEMGQRIKLRRKEMRMKQAELAERIDISNNHMSSIENGRQKPSLDMFIRICQNLNVTPDYLLLGVMCSQEDVELVREFVELLVKRSMVGRQEDNSLLF